MPVFLQRREDAAVQEARSVCDPGKLLLKFAILMFHRSWLVAAGLVLQAAVAHAIAPRIAFVRTVPPAHDLGSGTIVLIYAIGDSDRISTFLDLLIDHASREMQIESALTRGPHFLGTRPSDKSLRILRREHPASIYLGVNEFSCHAEERAAEGSEHDVDGGRVKRKHVWADAVCSARIDIMDGSSGKRTESFRVRGEGTSPRVTMLTDEERNIAFDQAARYAAVAAEELITPRRVRESIELDSEAPLFEEGFAMVEAGRLSDARAIWEAELRGHTASAPLQFDLAVLCEAAGDLEAARTYYRQAAELAPAERRYSRELRAFAQRNGGKAALDAAQSDGKEKRPRGSGRSVRVDQH